MGRSGYLRWLGALLLIAACATDGTGDTTTSSTATTTTTSPTTTTEATTTTVAATTSTQAEAAERHFAFIEPFTITIPPEWSRDDASTERQLLIAAGSNSLFFGVEEEAQQTTVEAWVQRLTGHANLITTEPTPTEVGEAPGLTLEVRLGEGATTTGCPPEEPCVQIGSGSLGWYVIEGLPNRLWIVDVDGTTVLIVAEAPESSFTSFVATVEEALTTLKWGGAPA